MTRRRLSVALAGVLSTMLLAPSPAEAWFGGGWLERLSGPGPFTTDQPLIEVRFLCFGPVEDERAVLDTAVRRALSQRLGENVWLGAGCNFLDRDAPRLEIGLGTGHYRTKTNPLEYDPPIEEGDREIGLRTWLFTADVRVNRTIDVGVGFGPARFTGAPFGTLHKWVWQPIRVTLRPLTPLGSSKRLEALVFRFAGQRFNGGFRDEEFGAKPGTFSEPGEFLATWAIIVDVGALVWSGR